MQERYGHVGFWHMELYLSKICYEVDCRWRLQSQNFCSNLLQMMVCGIIRDVVLGSNFSCCLVLWLMLNDSFLPPIAVSDSICPSWCKSDIKLFHSSICSFHEIHTKRHSITGTCPITFADMRLQRFLLLSKNEFWYYMCSYFTE